MVCPPCRAAGKENTKGGQSNANQLHRECEAPATCTCQHKIGKALAKA